MKSDFMSKSSKLALGIVSFIPLILVGVIIFMIFNLFPEFIEWDKYEPDARDFFTAFAPIFITGLLIGLISLGLLVFYIIHLVNNKQMESGEKIVWIFVFLFAGTVGYPVYWFFRIWNEKN
jgi:uncharacterized membrane protein